MLRRMRSVIAKRQAESKEENGESKHRTPNTEGRTPDRHSRLAACAAQNGIAAKKAAEVWIPAAAFCFV